MSEEQELAERRRRLNAGLKGGAAQQTTAQAASTSHEYSLSDEIFGRKTNQVAQATTNVQVTGISIPFGDVLMLSFQGLIAGLIIAIPIAFIISVMVNS